MRQKKLRPASADQSGPGLGNLLSSTDRNSEFNPSLLATQAAFLARSGLDATRARLTAELAWGHA